MLGANMKSDILVESRCRSEGRQCLQRRRSSKPSHENIEFDPDLALAIQESLKLAKQTGIENKDPVVSENRTTSTEHKEISEENILTPSRVDMESKMETRQLKDLLLLHIDLIQHQQEQLIQKDREISTLQKEKEALKCRLERMERRMSLVKHKEESLTQSQSQSPTTPTRQDPAQAHTATRTSSHRLVSSLDRGTKRKSHIDQQSLGKKFAAVSPRVMPERTWLKTPQHVLLHRPREQLIVSDVVRPSIKDQLKEIKCHIPTDEEPILRTDKHYYVSEMCASPRLLSEREPSTEPVVAEVEGTTYNTVQPRSSEPDLSELLNYPHLLEVPDWRVKTTTRYFNMEGTENLEDEIFIKRHQKPELEEKRRKRWDLQRMREQKQYEKLRQKELLESPKHKAAVESFHPSLEDVGYIEVSNKLPVTAFGNAIPHLKQIDFQLPWEPQSKPSNRQTRSRHK